MLKRLIKQQLLLTGFIALFATTIEAGRVQFQNNTFAPLDMTAMTPSSTVAVHSFTTNYIPAGASMSLDTGRYGIASLVFKGPAHSENSDREVEIDPFPNLSDKERNKDVPGTVYVSVNREGELTAEIR